MVRICSGSRAQEPGGERHVFDEPFRGTGVVAGADQVQHHPVRRVCTALGHLLPQRRLVDDDATENVGPGSGDETGGPRDSSHQLRPAIATRRATQRRAAPPLPPQDSLFRRFLDGFRQG